MRVRRDSTSARLASYARYVATRLATRLLVVNLLVLLVPVAGVEFARLYESSLLDDLERDMTNQAAVTVEFLALELEQGVPLGTPEQARALRRAAITTRTRIRVVTPERRIVLDSHEGGPPEGPEPRLTSRRGSASASRTEARWPAPEVREEVTRALRGERRVMTTRYRERDPGVLLFLAQPLWHDGRVQGAVYVVRSTQPVVLALHRIRRGLYDVLGAALGGTLALTLVFAFSISRPLSRLAKSARRIAAGERSVPLRVEGTGEVRELAEAVAAMTAELETRAAYAKDLSADVAHEFKSPLTSIRGAAELLADGASDDPAARARFLENILLDVERLDRLVSHLLALGRIEATPRGALLGDVAAVARRVADRSATPDVEVRLFVAPGDPTVVMRELDVETALTNLVENGVRHAPAGSHVEVHVIPRGDKVAVEVVDRGPGVPVAHRARIFDRFFTTAEDRNGTGLGLAIVKAVAGAHGGHVELVRGDPGETTFRFEVSR